MTPASLTAVATAPSLATMVGSALRFGRFRRLRRMAFWHVGPDRLTVAVVERAADEPVLHACASIAGEPQTPLLPFAPGIVEAARAVAGYGLRHAVALDDAFCRVVPAANGPGVAAGGDDGERAVAVSVPVVGAGQIRVEASLDAIETVVELFNQAHLSIAVLDCAACAVASLRGFLGQAFDLDEPRGDGERRVPDPLAAVSVMAESEEEAGRLGARLAVPVGLALGVFGLVTDADG